MLALVPVGVCAIALAACTGTSSSAVSSPTLITARPHLFLGSVPCSPGGGLGQLQSYVVTLTDVTPDPTVTTAPVASRPTSCATSVSFASPPLTLDHLFVGRIDGYDVPPEALQEGGALPSPRWTTTCGIAPTPTNTEADADDATDETSSADEVQSGAAVDAAVLYSPTRAIQYVDSDLRACLPFGETGWTALDGGVPSSDAALEASSPEAGSTLPPSTGPEAGALADVSHDGDSQPGPADAGQSSDSSDDSAASDARGVDGAQPDTAVPDGGAFDAALQTDGSAADSDRSDEIADDASVLDVTQSG